MPLIEARGIVKRYGGELALRGVDFDLHAGEIHALLGENGAGKSTLIKILAGVVARDAGELTLGTHRMPAHFLPAAVREAGVAFVHQDLGLLDHLSVAENIALAVGYQRRAGLISFRATEEAARRSLDELAVDVDPRAEVGSLRQDEKVMVAVARAFATHARTVVLDEVSSSLPAPDVAQLAQALRNSRASGVGYVYVTHRLDEVFSLADRLTVLRDGQLVATSATGETDYDQVVEWIVGESAVEATRQVARRRQLVPSAQGLSVSNLQVSPDAAPITFQIAGGEIVGLCGLVGCGARDVAAALGGARKPLEGHADLNGQRLPLGAPRALRERGCFYVPGDRQAEGGIIGMSIRENLFLISDGAGAGAGFIRRTGRERHASLELAQRLDVRPRDDVDRALYELSGGNQQKVVVGRSIRSQPQLIVLDDPTAGVDLGARAKLHEIIAAAADAGAAVLMASTDFEEVATEADRVLVMVRGRINIELKGDAVTPERLAHESYARAEVGAQGAAG
jgi:ribose transport system ATP-binding protein